MRGGGRVKEIDSEIDMSCINFKAGSIRYVVFDNKEIGFALLPLPLTPLIFGYLYIFTENSNTPSLNN